MRKQLAAQQTTAHSAKVNGVGRLGMAVELLCCPLPHCEQQNRLSANGYAAEQR